jgi:pyruvate/2-oxoglutarate dehydrogenase complex dihydrolipoamide acyltransferase (E2) component
MVIAQEPLKHDGETYAPGDEVDMTAEEAEENGLVAIGAVEVTEEVQATEAAAELAEEEDVDLASIDGTGSGGKILKSDVEDALE